MIKKIALLGLLCIHFPLCATQIMKDNISDKHDRFRFGVRLYPINSLVPLFREHCLVQAHIFSKSPESKEAWRTRYFNAEATLRGYFLEHIGTCREMVIGCAHTERAIVTGDNRVAFLSRPEENHLHEGMITVIDNPVIFKDGEIRTCIALEDDEHCPITDAYVLTSPKTFERVACKSFTPQEPSNSNETLQFLKPFDVIRQFPLGAGSKDLPENFFEKIYIERAFFTEEVNQSGEDFESLQEINRTLKIGGKLIFDYDGPPIYSTRSRNPLSPQVVIPETKYSTFDKCFFKFLDDKYYLGMHYALHDVDNLVRQISCFNLETWMPACKFPSLNRHYEKYVEGVLTDDNREHLRKFLWKPSALGACKTLESSGFGKFELHFNQVNPLNKRIHSRYIVAQKIKEIPKQ